MGSIKRELRSYLIYSLVLSIRSKAVIKQARLAPEVEITVNLSWDNSQSIAHHTHLTQTGRCIDIPTFRVPTSIGVEHRSSVNTLRPHLQIVGYSTPCFPHGAREPVTIYSTTTETVINQRKGICSFQLTKPKAFPAISVIFHGMGTSATVYSVDNQDCQDLCERAVSWSKYAQWVEIHGKNGAATSNSIRVFSDPDCGELSLSKVRNGTDLHEKTSQNARNSDGSLRSIQSIEVRTTRMSMG